MSSDRATCRLGGDRLLYLCWKGTPNEWLLTEDSETAKEMQVHERATAVDAARVNKE
jgi:hypothetical protein